MRPTRADGRRRTTHGRPTFPGRGAREPSFLDPLERLVMVGRVPARMRRPHRAAADDPARATRFHTGRGDRVLVIVAPRLDGENPFAVTEHDAVARVGDRTAIADRGAHPPRRLWAGRGGVPRRE